MRSAPAPAASPALARHRREVIAVERDRRCLPALAELEAEFAGQLTLIEGDALQIDERAVAGDGAHTFANLPYNVGTALCCAGSPVRGRRGGGR